MQDKSRDPSVEEALRWLVVLRDGTAGEQDRSAFDRWLAADPRHADAWRRAQYVWMRLDALEPVLRDQGMAAGLRASSQPAPRPPPRMDRRRWLQAAAVAAVAVPAGIVLSMPRLLADYRTAVGERRTVTLADGSTVELASNSSLSVSFDTAARRVVLHEGEAFFDVASEPTRPFVVEAAAGRTRALGTAFDIKLSGAEVTVSVIEHAVAVSADHGEPVVVGKGQSVRYGMRRISAVREADLAGVQAWRRDRLVFQEAPLGDVIADLERYRGGRIVMTDPRLRSIPVTAVFDTRQSDAALDTIANSLPIRVRRLTDLLVVLSPSG